VIEIGPNLLSAVQVLGQVLIVSVLLNRWEKVGIALAIAAALAVLVYLLYEWLAKRGAFTPSLGSL